MDEQRPGVTDGQATLDTFSRSSSEAAGSHTERDDAPAEASGECFENVENHLEAIESQLPGLECREAGTSMTTEQRLHYTAVRLELVEKHLAEMLADESPTRPRYID